MDSTGLNKQLFMLEVEHGRMKRIYRSKQTEIPHFMCRATQAKMAAVKTKIKRIQKTIKAEDELRAAVNIIKQGSVYSFGLEQ